MYQALERQLSIYSLLVTKVIAIAQAGAQAADGTAAAPQPPAPAQVEHQLLDQLPSPPPLPPQQQQQLFATWRLEEVVSTCLLALAAFYRHSQEVIAPRFVGLLWQHLVVAAPSAAVRRDALGFFQTAVSAKDCWLEHHQLAELLVLTGRLPAAAMTLGVAQLAWKCFFKARAQSVGLRALIGSHSIQVAATGAPTSAECGWHLACSKVRRITAPPLHRPCRHTAATSWRPRATRACLTPPSWTSTVRGQ